MRLSCLHRRLQFGRLFSTVTGSHGDRRWPGWEVVVGLEVHAQIKSRSKLFSSKLWTSDPSEPPNTSVSAYDAAFPGTLPRLNPKSVDLVLRTAIALHSEIQRRSAFDRKHYFYADLPAGYQITQHYAPIATGGHLDLAAGRSVRIKQIQIEQDTGKSTYDARRRVSLIDLNRAGTGLMEIVSEPDMRSPEEAGTYLRTLQALLRSVGSSDGNMEQGSLRCDVNVSVNKPGEPLGTRCEIKNLNSVKFMQVAIACEVFRQIELLEKGEAVQQETRGFDEAAARTFSLRSKEDAPDYRYMPDPNLPPLLLEQAYIDRIRSTMPELPDATRARLICQGLTSRDADVLMSVDAGREVGFDGQLGEGAVALTHDLLGQLTARNLTFKENPISTGQLGDLIDLVQKGLLTGTSGKTLLRYMLDHRTQEMPSQLARDMSLLALPADADNGTSELEGWCREAMDALPSETAAARQGNRNVVNKLVGRVMKISRGRANALKAKEVIESMLRA
ncbi:Glutamyl-tRNA Gln amidotransferase B subunit [Gloeophyllum trabeum ATCC 11539]|uniref:Glutamyl-tRNA(Gln) amidotransferase subunit B, mitochondrial n=1 Tax=Gloeophyllum trabeum (strain ATCC 11539 / FP-39264 / Madison 617) TaxID=670483 RepID=S7QGC4_GLOTA|nr:Glutamyl-tRNA Gln amidotransferase B subunit [Gloeophyllum trabeum ATCC 11539]EPQ58946.1 Glutamyl-tRNA Gln amidotransferase B subunit [Gloeophyllum trabeum ATCC 11539]